MKAKDGFLAGNFVTICDEQRHHVLVVNIPSTCVDFFLG